MLTIQPVFEKQITALVESAKLVESYLFPDLTGK